MITATFVPQVWINDYAVEVQPKGETTFDVTEDIESLGREVALSWRDGRGESDVLQSSMNAPEWVQAWDNPFEIRVEDSIKDHYAALSEDHVPAPPRKTGVLKHTFILTVLAHFEDQENVQNSSLKNLAYQIEDGDWMGDFRSVSIRRVPNDKIADEEKAMRGDGTFFAGESDKEDA